MPGGDLVCDVIMFINRGARGWSAAEASLFRSASRCHRCVACIYDVVSLMY